MHVLTLHKFTMYVRQHYDASIELMCDKWKIAKRVENPTPGGPEIEYTDNPNRRLYLDESACRDKKELARLNKAFRRRLTRDKKRKTGRRRFGQILTGSTHETVVTGFNGMGDPVPPVWVLNVEKITPSVIKHTTHTYSNTQCTITHST